ncbi:hypothetical protein JX265_006204 [Neoarthrinium moseri]|uniref:Uncharacterized protein n=1 Tax=Neoarthrinium moseri TaxID=1658444 RepID=A0A9P9WMB0_9PEZI|nr:hypothetical protein JX266_010375 [Neoarthrinium moseri]KAI1870034.1 hypothetical protein JX265_006204 [Neoarthrinium moseri]
MQNSTTHQMTSYLKPLCEAQDTPSHLEYPTHSDPGRRHRQRGSQTSCGELSTSSTEQEDYEQGQEQENDGDEVISSMLDDIPPEDADIFEDPPNWYGPPADWVPFEEDELQSRSYA